MKNKISISEEDLFKFVFYKKELSEEKQRYLEDNEKLFSEELEFVRSFSEDARENSGFNISPGTLTLFPDTVKHTVNPYKLKLAAASESLTRNIETITFNDADSNYTVRQVKQKDKNQLFIFPKAEDRSKNITLALYPSNLRYHSNKSATSIDLPIDIFIEKIAVTEEG